MTLSTLLRFYVFLLLVLFFLTSALLVVQSQNKSAGKLHQALLTASDCATPCLFSIRPGFTGIQAATQSLLADPQVRSFQQMPVGPDRIQTFQATIALDDEQYHLYLETQGDIIESIALHGTGDQLGDIFLSLGSPASLLIDNIRRQDVMTYVGFYPAVQMVTQVKFPGCLAPQTNLWQSRWETWVTMLSAAKYREQVNYFSVAPRLNEGWRQAFYQLSQVQCQWSE